MIFQAAWDGMAVSAALVLATWLRYDFAFGPHGGRGLVTLVPIAAALQVAVGVVLGLYRRRWRYGSFEEVAALALAVTANACFLAAITAVALQRQVPIGACIIAAPFGLLSMGAMRYAWRLSDEQRRRPDRERTKPLLVFGAGEGGRQTLEALLRNPNSPWYPVALLDDDTGLRNLNLRGVRVAGTRATIRTVAAKTKAEAMVIAIPSAKSDLIREISAIARDAELQVLTLPPVAELLGEAIGVSDIRPLTDGDMLGRHEVDTDVDAIAHYVTGHRVLVTGAGGSIGSELCRQLNRFAPAELVMLDRDESALHAVQLSLEDRAMLDDPNLVVADIRDYERMDEVFSTHRPQVVFHAAALKHLPLLEMHPAEAVKTNVWGTQHLLDAATSHGVERFVNISTDKAADPTSVLGYTKRIAERLTAAAAQRSDLSFLSVRFGNVLGSRGSVLTAFRHQIAHGGPLTVTHPEATRYFMTVEEAVQLVIQAGAIGAGGDVLVLDMGTPVRIDSVARQLIERAERHIEVVYTGLRPGEKLHEELFGVDETGGIRDHPMISHVGVAPMSSHVLHHLDRCASPDSLREELAARCQADDFAGGGSDQGSDGRLFDLVAVERMRSSRRVTASG